MCSMFTSGRSKFVQQSVNIQHWNAHVRIGVDLMVFCILGIADHYTDQFT